MGAAGGVYAGLLGDVFHRKPCKLASPSFYSSGWWCGITTGLVPAIVRDRFERQEAAKVMTTIMLFIYLHMITIM